MEPDLRATFLRSAPEPTRRLDLPSILGEARRRRRGRYLYVSAAAAGITLVAGLSANAYLLQGPDQTPLDPSKPDRAASPSPSSSASPAPAANHIYLPPRFSEAPGWFTETSGGVAVDSGDVATSWASTAPFEPEQSFAGTPSRSLRALSGDDILIVASLPIPEQYPADLSNPNFQMQELDLAAAEYLPEWEGQPRPEVPLFRMLAVIEQQYVDVRVFFATQDPPPAQLARAQAQLDRLQIPERRMLANYSEPGAPVFENLYPGWNLAAPPPEPRTDAVSVWSGRQKRSGRDLVLWGGYTGYGGTFFNDGFTWNPDTDSWTAMAPSPLSPRANPGAVWTGREVIIWGGYDQGESPLGDGAAYNPDTDTWRMLSPAPIGPAIPVASIFTGEEAIFWGSTERGADGALEGAAYNVETDSWRKIADAPAAINSGSGIWADGDPSERHEMIVFGAELGYGNRSATEQAIGIAYDPGSDTWRRLPDVELSPQAAVVAWTGEEVIAWDYGLQAAAYDRVRDAWRRLPDIPLEGSECYPETEAFGVHVLAWYCGQAALFDTRNDSWSRIELPRDVVAGEPVLAGHVMLFAGATHESDSNALWIYVKP